MYDLARAKEEKNVLERDVQSKTEKIRKLDSKLQDLSEHVGVLEQTREKNRNYLDESDSLVHFGLFGAYKSRFQSSRKGTNCWKEK